jgi:hypothetical protein
VIISPVTKYPARNRPRDTLRAKTKELTKLYSACQLERHSVYNSLMFFRAGCFVQSAFLLIWMKEVFSSFLKMGHFAFPTFSLFRKQNAKENNEAHLLQDEEHLLFLAEIFTIKLF